jgi:excisionase family DNA binding protein
VQDYEPGDDAGQFPGRIIDKAAADAERDNEGRIMINLHLKYAYGRQMLTGQAVSGMLQVSRGMLSRLVKDGKVRSYKIGRLRRFLLEDILAYISQNSDIWKLSTTEPQYRREEDRTFGVPLQR